MSKKKGVTYYRWLVEVKDGSGSHTVVVEAADVREAGKLAAIDSNRPIWDVLEASRIRPMR